MKVLFIVGSLNLGGTETYLLRFLKYSQKQFSATIIVTSGVAVKGDLSDEFLCLENVRIKYLKIGYRNPFLFIRYFIFLLLNRFDAICDFDGNFSGIRVLLAFCSKHKKRIVFYRQSSDLVEFKWLFLKMNNNFKYLVWKFATHILSNSLTNFRYFFEVTDNRFHIINNGINSASFEQSDYLTRSDLDKKLKDSDFIIGNTARYHPVKNHETIIKVATLLIKRYSNIKVVFVGRDVKEHVHDLVKNLNIVEHVIYLGQRKDIDKVIKNFNVFFFPSISEGQPNSLIEAMLAKVPFVTSDIPNILEIIPKDAIGQCCDPFNIEKYYELIEEIYHKGVDNNLLNSIQTFAKDTFDFRLNFDHFINVLKN